MKLETSHRTAANHLQGNFYEIKEKPTDFHGFPQIYTEEYRFLGLKPRIIIGFPQNLKIKLKIRGNPFNP
ncbi:MAG: hypothetical protein FWH41_04840 [Treponema sp.]|nr:hypothetical protein [Treponema sp.]